ncbi:MAG: substrate-binding domain-containing protein [Opitutaceae bacterium]|nr:substrate-binding domain-containing protein [Opitutaceae bacterium]
MSSMAVCSQINAFILQNGLAEGDRLPSERKLAKALGVSQAAINRAVLYFLGTGRLRREGYKLYLAAAPVSAAPLKFLLFAGELNHRRVGLKLAKQVGWEVEAPPCDDENLLRKLLLDLRPSDADGILLWGPHNHDLLKGLAKSGMPVVVCGTTSADFSFVTLDQRKISGLAVEHLFAFGHTNIGYIKQDSIASYGLISSLAVEAYQNACHKAGLHESAARVACITSDSPGDIEAAWQLLSVRENGITAVICPHPRVAQTVVELAKRQGLAIPADLSVVLLTDHKAAIRNDPPLTSVSDESDTLTRLGLQLLHAMATYPQSASRRRLHRVTLEPSLMVRASTVRLAGQAALDVVILPRETHPVRSWPHLGEWSSHVKTRREQAIVLNRKPFPRGLGSLEDYVALDLAPYANRKCSHEHSWLGHQPLLNLPSGQTWFHGVPFELLNEAQNQGRAAIVLKSQHAHSSAGLSLPIEVTLPVGRQVSAIYLLHGAGWTYRHQAFGEYVFNYSDGTDERVGAIPFAEEPDTHRNTSQWRDEAVIHDWHPNRGRFESETVMPCVITEQGDPLRYERYLYAWQWTNPRPTREVRSLTLRMFEPLGRATLGLLAVTLQVAR